MRKPSDSIPFLSKKRLKRVLNLRRNPRHYSGEFSGQSKHENPQTKENYQSVELSMLYRETGNVKDGSFGNRNVKVELPEVFSMIANPVESLKALYLIASQSKNPRIKSLYLDYFRVENIDLAAEKLLDVLVSELNKENKSRHNHIAIRGSYPASEQLERYIRAVGIISHFDIKHERLTAIECGFNRSTQHIG